MLKLADIHTVRVNADHGRDFHPLACHVTKLHNFTDGEFSVFPFSRQLMFNQTLNNVIICLVI